MSRLYGNDRSRLDHHAGRRRRSRAISGRCLTRIDKKSETSLAVIRSRLNAAHYRDKRRQFIAEYAQRAAQQAEGFAPHHKVQISGAGPLFTQLVVDAPQADQREPSDVRQRHQQEILLSPVPRQAGLGSRAPRSGWPSVSAYRVFAIRTEQRCGPLDQQCDSSSGGRDTRCVNPAPVAVECSLSSGLSEPGYHTGGAERPEAAPARIVPGDMARTATNL